MLDKTAQYEYNGDVYAFSSNTWKPVVQTGTTTFYWSMAQFLHFHDHGQVKYCVSPGETLKAATQIDEYGHVFIWLPYRYKDKTITFKITEVKD